MECRLELLAFDKYVGRGFGRLGVRQAAEQFEELSAVRRVGDAFTRKLGFSRVQLELEDLKDLRRPLEEFGFKLDGGHIEKHVEKMYGGPIIDGESDDEQ
jgi:hypothetical protein